MPKGGTLTIATRMDSGAAGSPRLVLTVADTGIGMDAATRERIFEPFFTTKEPGKGTGLGLSTVYGLVEQCGGELRVTSEPGRGSTFEVALPVGDPAASTEPAPVPRGSGEGGSETVLVVEDDASVRAFAVRVLREAGYVVHAAADGVAATQLAAAEARGIDLLLTDVVMPGIGGRELASSFAATHPGMRVLFTSGHTDDEILRRGIFRHSEQFLAKPYTPDVLLDAVRAALGGREPVGGKR
jgi:CheY-like chemotaxis protein